MCSNKGGEMNERIQKLLQKSYSHFGHGKYRTPELVSEKFAELLVKDVCKIIKGNSLVEPLGGYSDWDHGYNASVKSAIDQIKRQYKKPKKKSGDTDERTN